jgi:meiotically up-regulated gene 157 (Mug157) protein
VRPCPANAFRSRRPDPYANAYTSRWRDPAKLSKADRIIGRGGWVATRNYVLDSGAYFFSMLWTYYATLGVFGAERFLNETTLFDGAMLLVNTWILEQCHEERNPVRHDILSRISAEQHGLQNQSQSPSSTILLCMRNNSTTDRLLTMFDT